ncbi:hypothetical protein IG631_22167 [Alternaria alternata]|nr:hypothetical protein IG631_22167 [Alternaria alternata]
MFCLPIVLDYDSKYYLECLVLVATEGKDTFEHIGRLTIPVEQLLADYRRSELGIQDNVVGFGIKDNDSGLEDANSHVGVQIRDSAWHRFILS